MNKQQAQEQMKKLQEEMDRLKAIIDKPESVVWKPEEGETYYFIGARGGISPATWNNDNVDETLWLRGNCYRTEEKAKQADLANIILTHLQRLADEANGEVGFSTFEYHKGSWTKYVDGSYSNDKTGIQFRSQFQLRDAEDTLISEYGEDAVKMALSGMWRWKIVWNV